MSSIIGSRTNRSFNRRLKKASECTGDYFTPRMMGYWNLCYQASETKKYSRQVLKAFAMMDYNFLMNCIIEHLSIHLREMKLSIKPDPWMSITPYISYVDLIDFGQMILERFMQIQHDVGELPVIPGKTFVHRFSGYTDEERGRLRIRFKNVIREMYNHIDQQTLHSLNEGSFWIGGDDKQLLIPLDKYLSMCDACNKEVCSCSQFTSVKCTECGGECPVFLEPTTAPAPAQASDPLQALASQLITAKISFEERALELANVLLQNGVFQLSDLSDLKQHEFESLVQKLQLNTLQVKNLSNASGRQ